MEITNKKIQYRRYKGEKRKGQKMLIQIILGKLFVMTSQLTDKELEDIFENVENSIESQITTKDRTFNDAKGLETWLFVEYDTRLNSLLAEKGVHTIPEDKTDPLVTKIDFRKNEFFKKIESKLFR